MEPLNGGTPDRKGRPNEPGDWRVRADDSGNVTIELWDNLDAAEQKEAFEEAADALIDWLVRDRRSDAPIFLRRHLGDLADDRGLFLGRYCDFVYRDGRWRLEQTVWDEAGTSDGDSAANALGATHGAEAPVPRDGPRDRLLAGRGRSTPALRDRGERRPG